jgi:hypothetical protein
VRKETRSSSRPPPFPLLLFPLPELELVLSSAVALVCSALVEVSVEVVVDSVSVDAVVDSVAVVVVVVGVLVAVVVSCALPSSLPQPRSPRTVTASRHASARDEGRARIERAG